jgi:serine/threonine protein kinase
MERLGSTFGSYRIHQAILVGAAWTVYLASSSHGTRVVYRGASSTASQASSLWVSDVLPDIGAVIPLFLQQVNKSNELGHPVIPHILDVGERDGRVYFATQYQEGATLDELIRRHGRLPVSDAVSLLTPIADCLDYAHNVGLVHGAIGPNMIWIDSTREPAHPNHASTALTGFGLDILLRSHVLTGQRDDAIPDVLYVAPEQLRRGGGITDAHVLRFSNPDRSADQYALACALYHCVTGHPPFVGASIAALFNAHARAEAAPAEAAGETAARAITVGMAKEPGDRHPSCLDLMHATRSDRRLTPVRTNGGGQAGSDQHMRTGRSTVTMPSYAPAANQPHGNSRPRASKGSSHVGTWVRFALVTCLLIVTMVLLFLATSTFFS